MGMQVPSDLDSKILKEDDIWQFNTISSAKHIRKLVFIDNETR